MDKHPLRWSLLAAACLLLAACQDRREPVKPTVDLSGTVQLAPVQPAA